MEQTNIANESWVQWKACAAILTVHLDFMEELFVKVDDVLLTYDFINHKKMIAVMVAMLSSLMRQFLELMLTVNVLIVL